MLMEYTAEVLRGWPMEGAREHVETVKTSSTVSNGDLVEMQSDGTVDKSSSTPTDRAGLVVRGNGDSTSGVAAGNKAVVLWGNYIVRVSNYTAGSWAVGDKVTVVSAKFKKDAGSDPIVGHVIAVTAASATNTASITIAVK
jgi:hypothetical protein